MHGRNELYTLDFGSRFRVQHRQVQVDSTSSVDEYSRSNFPDATSQILRRLSMDKSAK